MLRIPAFRKIVVFLIAALFIVGVANATQQTIEWGAAAADLSPGDASAVSTEIETQTGGPTQTTGNSEFTSDFTSESSPFEKFLWLETPYSSRMLDFQNRQGDKELFILEHALRNPDQAFVIGAQFRASGLFGKTNRENKFPYLGRFPTDFSGQSASDFRILQTNQNVTLNINQSIHGYFETLFSDVFTFPDFKQGSYQVRQAYVLFGNRNASPFYAYIGKKNVSFGDMRTLSPFTQAVPWHYFAPLAEGAGFGFENGTFNGSVTLLNGSRGIRVVDSDEKGKLNNFAANCRWRIPLGENGHWQIGAGYLGGTIYNAPVAEHLDAGLFGPNNAAWDVNTWVRWGTYQFFAEYVQTADPWPATGFEVSAFSLELARDTVLFGRTGRTSISWSEGTQGSGGTEFEFNKQLVIGYRHNLHPNAFLTFEYVRNIGFAPLINIQTVSDRDVRQNSFVFGAVINL